MGLRFPRKRKLQGMVLTELPLNENIKGYIVSRSKNHLEVEDIHLGRGHPPASGRLRMLEFRKILFCLAGVIGYFVALPAAAELFLSVEGRPEITPAIQALEEPDRYETPGDQIRICSYNIQDFWEGVEDSHRSWEHAWRQARVAGEIIDEINADVLVLQEFESKKMVRVLNDKLKRPYAVGYITSFGSGRGRMNKLNLAVLSRFPLRNVTELDFASMNGPGRPTRGLMRFELELGDDFLLLVYNVHLKANWGDQQRNISQRHHALTVLREDWARWEETVPGELKWEMMVAGDFNVDPEHPSFEGDPSLHPLDVLVDLWAGRPLEERITVPTRYGVPALEFPPVAFDRFYVTQGLTDGPWVIGRPDVLSKGVNIEDVRVIAGEDDTTASDHYPVYVDLYHSRN